MTHPAHDIELWTWWGSDIFDCVVHQGKDRDLVKAAGDKLGLEGTYIPRSYIEQVMMFCARSFTCNADQIRVIEAHSAFWSRCCSQVQLEKLTAAFQNVTEDLKRRFVVNGEPLIDESAIVGNSPMSSSGGSFRRTLGFAVPRQPAMSSSGESAALPIESQGSFSAHVIASAPLLYLSILRRLCRLSCGSAKGNCSAAWR